MWGRRRDGVGPPAAPRSARPHPRRTHACTRAFRLGAEHAWLNRARSRSSSTMSDTSLSEANREATWAGWLLVVLGSLCAVAGIIVIARPSDSLNTLAVVVGILLLV